MCFYVFPLWHSKQVRLVSAPEHARDESPVAKVWGHAGTNEKETIQIGKVRSSCESNWTWHVGCANNRQLLKLFLKPFILLDLNTLTWFNIFNMTPIISRAFDVSAALDVSVAPSRGPWQEQEWGCSIDDNYDIMTLWQSIEWTFIELTINGLASADSADLDSALALRHSFLRSTPAGTGGPQRGCPSCGVAVMLVKTWSKVNTRSSDYVFLACTWRAKMLKVSQCNDHCVCVCVMAAHQTEWKKALDDSAMPSWHKAPVQWIHRRYTYYYSWNDTARVIYTASIYRDEWSTSTVEYTLGTTMRSRRVKPKQGE